MNIAIRNNQTIVEEKGWAKVYNTKDEAYQHQAFLARKDIHVEIKELRIENNTVVGYYLVLVKAPKAGILA